MTQGGKEEGGSEGGENNWAILKNYFPPKN